ncbi:hypothetical protein HC028_25985 [Planosporangium flavigriseum]|uniref:Histidine kinase/HSP90-like ATPase domain-containing protein n=1 Tax=Planosporangium flavigriseum TaxID=373681 RepID=A0A8J3PNJ6_9ACTN|nr:ATP-binding protein [Planosporangium flavigriseum]NJC67929.1 hypothetical protein [Planosporangium flavigriseum]GIG76681.1 hypothetical protein Pfl04_50850 [Planosporangium flavigriseum]
MSIHKNMSIHEEDEEDSAGEEISVYTKSTIAVADTSGLPELTIQLLFRGCRELLRNVLKHARATEATVTIAVEPAEVTLMVTDNGTGFDP